MEKTLIVKHQRLSLAAMKKQKLSLVSGLLLAAAASLAITACDSRPSDPYAAAQEAIADGEPREAMLILSEALSENPNDPETRLLMGEVCLALGESARAVTELKQFPTDSEFAPKAQALLAEAYLNQGNTKMASQVMETATRDNPDAFRVSAMIEMAEGKYSASFATVKQGLSKFPDNAELISMDAHRMLIEGKPQQARTRLAPILKIDPPVAQAHFLAGQLELLDQSPVKAGKHFEQVLQTRPAHQAALLSLAAIANDAGDEEAAKAWLARSVNSGSGHPLALFFVAKMAFDAGDIDEANSLVEKMPAQMKNMPDVSRLEGFIAAARGQRQQTIVALKRYLATSDADPLARRVLAANLAENGEFAEAWKVISPAIDDPQLDGGGLILAYNLAQKTGNGQAERLKQMIVRRDAMPSVVKPMREAGTAIRAGDWAKAEDIYAPHINGAGKDNVMLLNNAAAVKAKLGKYGEAVTLARRAKQLAPQSPQVLDTLGWSLWQAGNAKDEARQLLEQARKLAPNDREIAEHWAVANANI